MTTSLKTSVFGFICLISCTNEDIGLDSFQDDKSITSLNGQWKVESFEDYTMGTIELKTQENSWGHDITITFNDSKNPHEFSGRNITNSVFGEFDYVSSRQFKLQRFGSTFVGQPAWADKLGQAMMDDNSSFIISKTKLRVYYSNRSKSVTLIRL